MRVLKELILEVVGELSKEYAGQSLSADDIYGFMEDIDAKPEDVKKSLEELVVAKRPLMSKTEDGEYYYSGTQTDLSELGDPDIYEVAEKEELSKAEKNNDSEKSNQVEAANYGMEISESLFPGHGSKGEEGEIPSPYAVIASEFPGNKKSVPEGILLQKTGFDESFFKAVVAKMQSDGALEIMPTEEFEDFDETVYQATSKTKAYVHHVISINDVKPSSAKPEASKPKEEKPEAKEVVSHELEKSIDEISNAKEFLEFAILTNMEEGIEYSKHGLAADLSNKYDGDITKFGSLGKARFASAIEKLAEDGKIDTQKRGKSSRYSLPEEKLPKSTSEGKKDVKKASSVSKDLDFLNKPISKKADHGSKKEKSHDKVEDLKTPADQEAKAPVAQEAKAPADQEAKAPVAQEAKAPVAQEAKAPVASTPVASSVQTGIPSMEHPAYNLAVLIKAAQISGHVDINAIAKEFEVLMVGMSSSSDKDKEISSLKARVKKFESILKQLEEA